MRWLLCLTLLAVSGCGVFNRPKAEEVVRVGDREAQVYQPSSAKVPAPLVVMLHGGFGTGSQARRSYGWDAAADASGFLVAYPDGLSRTWNAGGCCGPSQRDGVADAKFLHDLVGTLVAKGLVDPQRVYATGMSNGAMMSYAWACAYPDDLAGIAPVAGARVAACDPAPALPVVAIHGDEDHNVPIEGGVGIGLAQVDYPSFAESVEPFITAARCASPSAEGFVTRYQCAGPKVVTVVVPGAGHQWPGSEVVRSGADEPFGGFDATTFIWTEWTS